MKTGSTGQQAARLCAGGAGAQQHSGRTQVLSGRTGAAEQQ